MQTAAELHDIPANPEPIDPAGAGVTWTRQLVPSHRSASGTLVPELSRLAPPAVHAVAEGQDTAKNSATAGPAGLGVAWTRQLVPSHRSASAVVPVASVWAPTAVHAVAEVQETAKKPLSGRPSGLGAAWMRQLVPSHRSASGWICRRPSV